MTTSAPASPVVPGKKRAASTAGRYFYFGMSLLIAAVVIYGFSHTVDHNLIHGNPARPWLLWLHGSLFSGWIAFFILQSGLVRTHNVRVHRTLGWFGAALAGAMTVVGCSTAMVMGRFDIAHFHYAWVAQFLIVPFWDIACFTTFFWLAVYWRRKPELHRRLMLIATCALTSAAWGRVPYTHFAEVWFYSGVDGLILLGVLRDLVINRSVHRVYRYALPALVIGQVFVMRTNLTGAPWWTRLAHALLRS